MLSKTQLIETNEQLKRLEDDKKNNMSLQDFALKKNRTSVLAQYLTFLLLASCSFIIHLNIYHSLGETYLRESFELTLLNTFLLTVTLVFSMVYVVASVDNTESFRYEKYNMSKNFDSFPKAMDFLGKEILDLSILAIIISIIVTVILGIVNIFISFEIPSSLSYFMFIGLIVLSLENFARNMWKGMNKKDYESLELKASLNNEHRIERFNDKEKELKQLVFSNVNTFEDYQYFKFITNKFNLEKLGFLTKELEAKIKKDNNIDDIEKLEEERLLNNLEATSDIVNC